MADACRSCGSALVPGSARCSACGKLDLERAREISRAGAEVAAQSHRARTAARVLLNGSLAVALLVVAIESFLPETLARALAEHLLFAMLVLAGLWPLGEGAFKASFGARVRFEHLLPTIATGIVSGFLWWGWNWILLETLGDLAFGARNTLNTTFWLSAFLVPVLVQEVLCRGITWLAVRSIQSPKGAILTTAAQFALVYGIAWQLPAIPSRFVIGLLLGRLRERTGSLAPCIAAHLLARGLQLALPL